MNGEIKGCDCCYSCVFITKDSCTTGTRNLIVMTYVRFATNLEYRIHRALLDEPHR